MVNPVYRIANLLHFVRRGNIVPDEDLINSMGYLSGLFRDCLDPKRGINEYGENVLNCDHSGRLLELAVGIAKGRPVRSLNSFLTILSRKYDPDVAFDMDTLKMVRDSYRVGAFGLEFVVLDSLQDGFVYNRMHNDLLSHGKISPI